MARKKNDDDMFSGVELETPSNTNTSVKDVVAPDAPPMHDPKWNDYVMGLFSEDELFDGRPLVAGLRRVAELILGRIVKSVPNQVFPPKDEEHFGRAVISWIIEFESGEIFGDVGDSWVGNTDDAFCPFNVATAATRAEGRALRKALRIKTVSAEEMTKKDTEAVARNIVKANENKVSDGSYREEDRASDAQINFIDIKCKQLDVDAVAFLSNVFNVKSISKMAKGIASKAIDELNGYQRDTSKIPNNVVGYVNNWRN